MSAYQEWLDAKEAERVAVERRRAIEDTLLAQYALGEQFEGTMTEQDGAYTVKVVGRMSRTVDSELLQELAAENGISMMLGHLFRWKPEINAGAWKNASPEITAKLAGAITTKPGRPSFTISKKD